MSSFVARKLSERGWVSAERETKLVQQWDVTTAIVEKGLRYAGIPVLIAFSSYWFEVPILSIVTPAYF